MVFIMCSAAVKRMKCFALCANLGDGKWEAKPPATRNDPPPTSKIRQIQTAPHSPSSHLTPPTHSIRR